MCPPREIELKLEVPEYLPRLTASSLLRKASRSAAKPVNPVSVYFDTDKLQLHQKGLSLRVRQIGRHHVQTIKQENSGNTALFARGEWEHNVPSKRLDLDAARETALAPLLTKRLCRALKPVFETRVRRRVLQMRSGRSDIELSIDKGKVEAGRKSSPLCEVELELKQGQAADLFKLAKMLAHEVPVQLAVKSKADRGYALCGHCVAIRRAMGTAIPKSLAGVLTKPPASIMAPTHLGSPEVNGTSRNKMYLCNTHCFVDSSATGNAGVGGAISFSAVG
jgi:inorganic triphosphatase YgiF